MAKSAAMGLLSERGAAANERMNTNTLDERDGDINAFLMDIQALSVSVLYLLPT